jgi:hypothetical protein
MQLKQDMKWYIISTRAKLSDCRDKLAAKEASLARIHNSRGLDAEIANERIAKLSKSIAKLHAAIDVLCDNLRVAHK